MMKMSIQLCIEHKIGSLMYLTASRKVNNYWNEDENGRCIETKNEHIGCFQNFAKKRGDKNL